MTSQFFKADAIVKPLEEAIVKSLKKFAIIIIDNSYYLCLLVGVASFILYMFGWKKCKDVPIISIGVYLLLKIIGGVLFGIS